MKAREEGSIIFAKLDDGEDLFGCIEKICSEFKVSSGIILSNIGMLRDFELNFYSPDGYQPKLYTEPMELVGSAPLLLMGRIISYMSSFENPKTLEYLSKFSMDEGRRFFTLISFIIIRFSFNHI